jgi:IS30 family transposase
LRDGWGVRTIARSIGRAPGTVSDEVNRNGGAAAYEAGAAEGRAAAKRDTTGRKPRMSRDGPLFTKSARLLGLGWSPEQVSGRRKREDAGMQQESGFRVSHEAIYAATCALPRGELRRELIGCLRHATPARGRKPKGSELRGKLAGMTNIKDRPGEIEDRLVPGHWEGDLSRLTALLGISPLRGLILGAKGASAIGTLAERTTRFVVPVRMPTRKADVAAGAFAGALNAIPESQRKALTYDQGKEVAGHAGLAEATGMRIFFADPHSPWQRGANENTNGLLRQYFPKGTPLSGFGQADLDAVADSLNDRPRKTLDFATPGEHFRTLLAGLAG